MKAAFPLAGGALNAGSTCGVVSGGCMGLALARADTLSSGDPADAEAVYAELREYTRWFENSFGTTLCSERTGMDFSAPVGLTEILQMGKVITRCLKHTGRAANYLVAGAGAVRSANEGGGIRGLCATPVLEGMREERNVGDPLLEAASFALDGGIGLSGGLCGALAVALMALGGELGIDPGEAGVVRTLKASADGVSGGRADGGSPDMFSVGTPLVAHFKEEFGALECRAITGRTFEDFEDLRSYIESSAKCAEIKKWCLTQASALEKTSGV